MQELKRNELGELKRFFVGELKGWTDGFFQILFLLEDAKIGVYLQQEDERRKLKRLRNMLYWFGLYVSMRHGGYATKNKGRYKEWNKFFGFERDTEKFLGYPSCCVRTYNLSISGNTIGLYSLIKEIRFGRKSIKDLRQYIINERFLHHRPCKSNCIESINLERKFESVIRKYSWLVNDLLPDYDKQTIIGIVESLELLPTAPIPLRKEIFTDSILAELEINPILKKILNMVKIC